MKYIIEHLEEELNPWTHIEYRHISLISDLTLTSVNCKIPEDIKATITPDSVSTFNKSDIILLDPKSTIPLSHADNLSFKYLLFGGILGDVPSKDRTSVLREMGFTTRHLGPIQLPTDHAVLFANCVMQGTPLEDVPYIDEPVIQLSRKESVTIPMRFYTRDGKNPVLAEGLIELLKKQNEDFLN